MALTQVASGLIASVAASTLTGTQTIPKSTLPTGSVLQVVNATNSTQITTTSSSYVTSNVSASITPSFATSKILALWNGNIRPSGSANTFITWYRGGVLVSGRGLIQKGGTSGGDMNQSMQYLDSPATTSSITYTVYFMSEGGSATSTINPDSTTSVVTLMEISA
jgi:hypothetical protein